MTSPNKCDRCGAFLSYGEMGGTIFLRQSSKTIKAEITRTLCDRCFLAVAKVMTQRLPGGYGDDDNPLGGADILTEGGPR